MQFRQFNLVSLYAFASREYAFVNLRAEDIALHSLPKFDGRVSLGANVKYHFPRGAS